MNNKPVSQLAACSNALPPDVRSLLAALTQSAMAKYPTGSRTELRARIVERLDAKLAGFEQQVDNLDRALHRASTIVKKAEGPRRHALENIERCNTLKAYLHAQEVQDMPDSDY